MRGKLLGFALALLSVATIGVVQLTTNAQQPGQIGSKPVCTVKATGARASAFAVSGTTATVRFKVSGAADCRVQLSANSFYAPSMNGMPYSKQILFQRVTKNYTRGSYSLSVKLPSISTPKKGCYYQVDLTYGTHNVTPVLAYGHGKVKCGTPPPPPPSPSAVCKSLTVKTVNRTTYSFFATSEVKNGAKVKGYDFTVSKDGNTVKTLHSGSTAQSGGANFYNATPGTYKVKVVVDTTEGKKASPNCEKSFTVPPPEEKPTATCESLVVSAVEPTQLQFDATAAVTGGATISAYEFTVSKDGSVVDTEIVTSSATTASIDYAQEEAGDYTVKAVVKTSLGDRSGPQCEEAFTIPEEETTPDIKITKYVENLKYKRVGVNVEYEYQIAVTNTGDTDLINAVVTDRPDQGISLVSAEAGSIDNNIWTYTIPELKVGETLNFTLKAKVPIYLAGRLANTVCVDVPEVPGNPDDCDTAHVDVPPPGKTEVCDPETGDTITVEEKDAGNYLPVGSPECETTPETPPEQTPPSELPQTGATDVVMQLVGATSLAGAGSYYVASRRQRL